MDVRNSFNKKRRLRSFLKGARANKQKSRINMTWQSAGNDAFHTLGIDDPKELETMFDKMFTKKQGENMRDYGRHDPWKRDDTGIYYIKGKDEN
jgi:hypothetical protein